MKNWPIPQTPMSPSVQFPITLHVALVCRVGTFGGGGGGVVTFRGSILGGRGSVLSEGQCFGVWYFRRDSILGGSVLSGGQYFATVGTFGTLR